MTDPPRFSRNPQGRVALFANKARIDELLKGGMLLLEIYEKLQLPGSYKQFTRFCERELGRTPLRRNGGKPGAQPAPAPAPPSQAPTLKTPSDGPRRPVQRTKAVPPWDPANIDKDRLTGRTET